jgi:hypothetical protein
MKGGNIADKLQAQLHTITGLLRRVMSHFERETIHELRTELKKLHAFLNLLYSVAGHEDLRFRKRLKTLYGYLGIIHNLQLQQHFIHSATQAPAGISEYLTILQGEMEKWKRELVMLMSDHTGMEEEKQAMLAALPRDLSKAAVKKYLSLKAEEMSTLLMLRTIRENNLHELRKLLKDVLYNWDYLKRNAQNRLPKGLDTLSNIRSASDLLSLYGNQCMILHFLQPEYTGKVRDKAAREFLQSAAREVKQTIEKLENEFLLLLLQFHPALSPAEQSQARQ